MRISQAIAGCRHETEFTDPGARGGFREYLRTLPDDLLASVTQDYVWLADLDLPRAVRSDCERRRDFCRAECAARGAAELYWTAREAMRGMRKAG